MGGRWTDSCVIKRPMLSRLCTVTDASVTCRACVRAGYLCCSEEDVLADVSDGAGDHPQADAREDVGVVPLAGVEGPPIRQRDRVERAAAGEDASTLRHHGAHFILFRLFDRNSAG